jgi:alcohol dehydrogenase (cytochrome c)
MPFMLVSMRGEWMNSNRITNAWCCTVAAAAALFFCDALSAGETATESGAQTQDVSWPMYNLNYESTRYVGLASIDARNVSRLREVCRVRVGGAGAFQSGLVQADGLLYLTTATATVALDPTDCSVVWKSVYAPEQKEPFPVNRGPAFADGRIFRGTTDCRLLALDAATGAPLWKVKPCDPEAGEWLAAAPIVWNDMIFIGIAGGDSGVKGRMFAFDALSGREIWQFHTVAQSGDFGADTWKGDSALTGGGGTWSSYTLDPKSAELFVSVGNPAADFDAQTRAGANLFTNSLVVLDARTGALKWWYQLRSHDDKDLDLGAAPMLFELPDGRPAVAMGSKDGHLYIVDRRSHRLLSKTPVTTVLNQDQPVTVQGIRSCPSVVGGVEWNGPAYDPQHGAIVVGAVDWCAFVKKDPKPEFKRGEFFLGGTFQFVFDPPPSGWITSVDKNTGRVRWHFHAEAPVVSGITSTAGGLIFAGDMSGNLYALDSDDGTVRFKNNLGGAIAGGVITYQVGERQYVAATSGNVSRLIWGETGLPYVVIFRLNTDIRSEPRSVTPGPASASNTDGRASARGAVDSNAGGAVFARVCSGCHGSAGEGLTGPGLKRIGERMSVGEIAAWVMNPTPKDGRGVAMPRLFPSALTERDVSDVAEFVAHL